MYQATTLAATGNVGANTGGCVHALVVTGGSDACTVTLTAANPTTVLAMKAAANTTVTVSGLEIAYSGQLVATITGTAPSITVVH